MEIPVKLNIECEPADIEALGKLIGEVEAAKGAGWMPLLERMIQVGAELMAQKERIAAEERVRLRSVPFTGATPPNGSGPKAV